MFNKIRQYYCRNYIVHKNIKKNKLRIVRKRLRGLSVRKTFLLIPYGKTIFIRTR